MGGRHRAATGGRTALKSALAGRVALERRLARGPPRRLGCGMHRGLLIAFLLSFGPTVSNSFARFAYALVLPAMRTDLALDWSSAGWLNRTCVCDRCQRARQVDWLTHTDPLPTRRRVRVHPDGEE